jgi:hypothetical protein
MEVTLTSSDQFVSGHDFSRAVEMRVPEVKLGLRRFEKVVPHVSMD